MCLEEEFKRQTPSVASGRAREGLPLAHPADIEDIERNCRRQNLSSSYPENPVHPVFLFRRLMQRSHIVPIIDLALIGQQPYLFTTTKLTG